MNINILSFQQIKEMSLVQFSTEKQNTFDYISLTNAIEKNYLEITEIDETADVNNIIAYNKSDKYIFIMDGDILEGAKQNRVMNTSVLLAPNRKYIIPVSCVEQGRWNFVSKNFKSADYSAPFKLRSKKMREVQENLFTRGEHLSNQGEVWEDVHRYASHFRVSSATANLSDVYKKKESDFKEFIDSFEITEGANGIAVFARKKMLCIDVFNRTDIYSEYFEKILKSVAFEIFSLKEKDEKISEAEAKFKTQDFFDTLENTDKKEFDSVGVGSEFRYQTDSFTGFYLQYKEHLIHLTGLSLN